MSPQCQWNDSDNRDVEPITIELQDDTGKVKRGIYALVLEAHRDEIVQRITRQKNDGR